jgi:two-component system, response regulator RegA
MQNSTRTVLIIDDEPTSAERTARAFATDGWTVALASDLPAACDLVKRQIHPGTTSLVVSELRVKGRWAFDHVEELRANTPGARIWILTDYPSVATAVRAVRLGFDAYIAKPIQPKEIPHFLEEGITAQRWTREAGGLGGNGDGVTWPSLDRTIWEFINQVFAVSGTLSEAARRLRLDRRSLRRMLAKYPPAA